MSIINTSKTKLMFELRKKYPRLQIVDEIASVILAGEALGAIDETRKRKRWEFIKNGAKDAAFYAAYKKYGLLVKKEKELKRYFEYKRPHANRLDNNTAILNALKYEQTKLYAHMLSDHNVRNAIVKTLSLPSKDLTSIKRAIEKGSLYEQLNVYGKILRFLMDEKLYHQRHDYYIIGFRNIPHHYWLSKVAIKLLADAKK
ncbi:MAG: hypothetical protein K5785_00070 [Nitrosarchaeum sp.]|nr:hypothetical protein [Nitrosarchaeum sp.]